MKFIVTTTNPTTGETFWLKRTTWAFSRDRAEEFPTREAAEAALTKSKQFNKPWAFKRAVVEEVG